SGRSLAESIMTFERPWMLIIALLPLLWMTWELRRTRRKLALILKALSFTAILLAIAEPRLTTNDTKMAVAVLVDTSASVSDHDLDRASQLATALDKSRGRNWVRILPFARNTRTVASGEHQSDWKLQRTSGDAGHATDFEAAIRAAIADLPAGLLPRLVLITDGKENAGSITRAAWQAENLGIPIDTFALQGRPEPGLRLQTVNLPTVAFTGERFPINVSLIAPRAGVGHVEIRADDKLLASNPMSFEKGENQVRLHASLITAGALNLSVNINAQDSGSVRFDRAITLRRPRILYLSQDPEGTEAHLLQTLSAAQFDIERSNNPLKANLNDYQVVVFNNWDLDSLPADRKDQVERFVKQGGGLLVIGGEHNVYADTKKVEDALDRSLPANLAPPRSPEGTSVVIIIDKSSSMEGKKIELARQSAIGVIDNLRPIDQVGVLIFDNSFQWAVPIRRAEDRSLIKRLVSGITPDGGTQIAPALTEAYRKILPTKGTFKHIVLLTDGISEEGDSLDLAKEAANQHVTISTVGLGQDVNRGYLEKVANMAGGKAYFLNEPTGLEQILLKDVMEHTGSTAIEKSLKAVVAKKVEILEGVGIESAPALKGYVKFIAKPTAETILTLDEKDPLLARWQYGLGRSVVFASDAKSRWAADWVTWKGFDKFWTNLFRDLLPHAEVGEAKAEYDSASGELIVDYQLGRNVEEPKKLPSIFVLGPAGFQHPLVITKAADRVFRGRIPIGQRQGLFRVRPLEESRAFPEVGFYRPEQEMQDYGSNEYLLKEISDFTGGRFNPNPRDVFDPGGRSTPSTMRLWPGMLGLAIILNIAELFLRKARTVFS
ncbi:MAG: VWA domain-containing protein, partial [Acidobacteriota bacterium]|nr:VWA domain-containing protein [Acidobacteriota bacterium]